MVGRRDYFARVRRNGETNPVTIIVILALIAAGFYAYHVVPVYLDNATVREKCQEAFNIYWVNGDNMARQKLTFNVNTVIGEHFEVDEDGVERVVKGLGVPEDDIFIEESDETLTVRVTYARTIQFSPLKNRKTFQLMAEKVGKKGQ